MHKIEPVETPVGILGGRDAIFLHDSDIKLYPISMTLKGIFDGQLSSTPVDEWLYFTLVFSDIIAFKITTLDAWHPKTKEYVASFVEYIDSPWITSLRGRSKFRPRFLNQPLKHYRIQTYDHVFEVVSISYEITITGRKPIEE